MFVLVTWVCIIGLLLIMAWYLAEDLQKEKKRKLEEKAHQRRVYELEKIIAKRFGTNPRIIDYWGSVGNNLYSKYYNL